MRKKILPVLVVFCLIIIVAVAGVASALLKRYTPSKERMDGQEYFQLQSENQAALVVDNQLTEEKLFFMDGRYYVEDSVVGKYINSRFYWDEQEKVMLYSLPTEIIQIVPDTKGYETGSDFVETDYVILRQIEDNFYLDFEFINAFSPIGYAVYETPARVVIRTEGQEVQAVEALKDTVIRKKGGIKSVIVDDIEKGEKLYLEEQMENWSRVSTEDGYTGYLKNDVISEAESVRWTFERDLPTYTNLVRDYKINLGWHQVTSKSGNEKLEEILANTSGLNTISPTWFSVIDNAGSISSLASASYVQRAHARGLEVWGLISNFSSTADTLTFLSSTKARNNIISQLMKEAEAVGLDGINLDFESITESQAPHYVQFIRELSVACRLNGLVFSVDVPVPMSFNKHYNRKEQGIVADYVIIMGYDEHYSGSQEAGSVASIHFVKNGIIGTLEDVPREKIVNGIPFYTRVWTESFGGGVSSEVLSMGAALNYIKEHGMDVYWDSQMGQNVATLETDDALYTIWLEDDASIEEKMKLVKEYNLAGAASWRLGLETDSVWNIISKYLE